MARTIQFNVNGKPQSVATEPTRSLLEVLRDDLQLTGTKYGCGEGACGACTVLVDGQRTFSCSTPILEVDGKSVITIEGLAMDKSLHPVQQAFLDEGAYQCGYCTPGMIMATVGLLQGKTNPTQSEVIEALNGHLCRCCGYPRILSAVKRAAELTSAHASRR